MKKTLAPFALCLAAAAGVGAVGGQQTVVREVEISQLPGGPIGGGRGGAPMAVGTGLIFGQAVEGSSSRPVPGVLVTLTLPGVAPLRALADGQGRFAFRDLPKGRFGLSLSKAGYVDGAYGRTRPSGPTQTVDLEEGERLGGITVPIWKYAAIAGYVTDEGNEPIVGAQVRVLRRSIVGGQSRLVPGPTDLTDDRGAFRIGALEPGDYVVAVPMSQNTGMADNTWSLAGDRIAFAAREVAAPVIAAGRVAVVGGGGGAPLMIETSSGGGGAVAPPDENGRPQAYPTQFYPSASSSTRAASVTVDSGEERTGIDFQLKPVRTLRVAGTIVGPDGPAANMPVTLVPAEAEELATPIETLSASSDASGSFSFPAVPAGQYVLRASRMPRGGGPASETIVQQGGMVLRSVIAVDSGGGPPLPTDPTLWAESTIAVGASDINDIVVSLRVGLKVTGQVQFEGTAERPAADRLGGIAVMLEPAAPRGGAGALPVRGRIEASGLFQTMGVPPGKYFLRVIGAPPGWTFRGAMLGGQDVSETPLEIESGDVTGVMLAFTDRPNKLSGQVSDTSGGKDAGATVIVFPADSGAWVGYASGTRRLRNVRVDKNGAYTAENLPAGDYLAAAIPDRLAGDWQNPKFLAALAASATRVRIGPGENVTQNLQVVR